MYSTRTLATVLASGFLAASAPLRADVFVAPGGPGPSPFGSWATAAPDIQAAITAAAPGETIYISNGVYSLNATVSLPKNLTLIGVPENDPPTLDGQGAVKCLEASAGTTVGLRHLRIVNGSGSNGAGARLDNGSIHDCFFSNNVAGAGLYITGSGTVARTVFVTNTISWAGGAIYAVNNPYLRIDSCRFNANFSVTGGGGALRLSGVSSLLMTNCQLIGNSTGGNGGAIVTDTLPAGEAENLIANCLIADNASGSAGGGMFLYGVGDSYTVTDCVFSNNTAAYNGGGAVIQCASTLRDSLVVHNRQTPATDLATRGGGGLTISAGARVVNCRIESNASVYQGAGVFMNSADCLLRNCLILNNSSTGASYGGGGIRFRFDNAGTVESSTIVSNYAYVNGGGIDARDNGIRLVNCILYANRCNQSQYNNYRADSSTKSIAFTNCCFTPALSTSYDDYSADNIADNPQFADADYRLSRQSPCVNNGINQAWMGAARDRDGRPRLDGIHQQADIGCYEYPFPGQVIIIR